MSHSLTGQDAGWYEIRLAGRLSPRWTSRFDGMTLVADVDGTTRVVPSPTRPPCTGSCAPWGDLGLPVISLSRTAVALFPVVKRVNEALAPGFVTSRMFEAAVIMIGVVSLLAVVTLRQELAGTPGADTAALTTTGAALVAVRDWTFLLGPGLAPALDARLLGTLLYRSRLVPRVLPVMGLIGAPLLLAATLAGLLGQVDQVSSAATLAALPVAAWELSLGCCLVVTGFKPSPVTAVAG